MKTKKNASKRLTVRSGGTIKRDQAFKRHTLAKKTAKNKCHLRDTEGVHEMSLRSVHVMIPYA